MATPITAKTFRDIVENQLSQIFEDVYEEHGWGFYKPKNDYEIKVDFDGKE